MPNRWPINSGSWSDAAIWSGSLIPTASDDVFLNNQTVILDTNITISSIRNAATSSAVAGGTLEIYGDYNITCNVIRSTVTTGWMINNYSTGSVTVTAQLNADTANEGRCIRNNSGGILNIIGNIYAARNGSVASLRTVGNVSGSVNVIGNLLGASAVNGNSNSNIETQTGVVNITGNILAGTTAGAAGAIVVQGSNIINVTGNIQGGSLPSGQAAYAISNAYNSAINITGTATGGTATGIASPAINSTDGVVNVIGTCQASTQAPAIQTTGTKTILSGPLVNSGSKNAIYCDRVYMYATPTTRYTIGVSGSNDTITLYSPDQIKVPLPTNVRAGITYGVAGEFTGSMQIPNPASVSWGVATDNTVGTAVTTATDVWNYAATTLTASNSIGQRLANAASSASTAAITNFY